MNKETIAEMNDGILELKALVDLWASTSVSPGTVSSYSEGTAPSPPEYNFDKLKIQHETPVFTDVAAPATPKMQMLFQSVFDNDGDSEQENNFRAERQSVSRADITVHEGVCLPINGVMVSIPDRVAGANAGFPTELNVCKTDKQAWEESMRWSVDTKIHVGPRKKVRAKMLVKEEQWAGDFSIKTTIKGKLRGTYFLADGKVKTLHGDIAEVVRKAKENGLTVAAVNVETRPNEGEVVTFTTKGRMEFRYGVEQNVKIAEVTK